MDITVKELKERMDRGEAPRLIDVREPHEAAEIGAAERESSLKQVADRVADLRRLIEIARDEDLSGLGLRVRPRATGDRSTSSARTRSASAVRFNATSSCETVTPLARSSGFALKAAWRWRSASS